MFAYPASSIYDMTSRSKGRGMTSRQKFAIVLSVLATVVGATTLSLIDVAEPYSVQWRLEVLLMKLKGDVDELGWWELLAMLRQRGGYGLNELPETNNVHAALRNPFQSEDDVSKGAKLFQPYCAPCHGADATGDSGPDLTTGVFGAGSGDLRLFRVVTDGIPETAMTKSNLEPRQAWQVIAFLRPLVQRRRETLPSVTQLENISSVTNTRLRSAGDDGSDWLMYSGSYSGQHYSRLDLIDRTTVARMRLKWLYQLDSGEDPVEAIPLVVDDVMYVAVPPNSVIALRVADGKLLWKYSRDLIGELSICCFRTSRGLAAYGDRVYMGTFDARLVALDARTGQPSWEVEVARPEDGYSITGAPLAVDGKIVTGVAGGEFGIRGFVAAYDADTGDLLWRFHTVPESGEPGSDTWAGDSWERGGGPTWLTGSFDPELNLIYWGVGNPGPVYDGSVRLGDNLYTCSVIALDADSGELRWHFQFTPHDVHDWDANQIPVLAELLLDGLNRKVMLWANRNGFYYVIDRESGEFLRGRPFVKVTWATGLSPTGRPILNESLVPSEAGTLVWPSSRGGTNWWSPSYNPSTGLFYVGVEEQPGLYYTGHASEWRGGEKYLGGSARRTGESRTYVRALESGTGELVWEYEFEVDAGRATSGLLSTAGQLVFVGGGLDNARFVALDAQTGLELWRAELGGRIHASPITFLHESKQLVTIAAGRNLLTFESRQEDE